MTFKKTLFWLSTKSDINFIFKSIFLIIITNVVCNYGIMDVLYVNLLKRTPEFLTLDIARYLYFTILFMTVIALKFILYGVKSKNMDENVNSNLEVYSSNIIDNFFSTFLTVGFAVGVSLLSGLFFILPFFYYFQRFIFSVFYTACKAPVENSDFKHYFCTNTLEKIDSITFNKKIKITLINNFFLFLSVMLFFIIPEHIDIYGINISQYLKYTTIDIFIIHIVSIGIILDNNDENTFTKYKTAEKMTQASISSENSKYNQKLRDKAGATFFDPKIHYKKEKLK